MNKSTAVTLILGFTFILIMTITSLWEDRTAVYLNREEEYYCMVHNEWLQVDEYRVSSIFTSYYMLDGDRHDYSDVLDCKTDVTLVSSTKEITGIETRLKRLLNKIF